MVLRVDRCEDAVRAYAQPGPMIDPTARLGGAEMFVDQYSYADVVERLLAEFEGSVPLPVIVDMTHLCREQLRGSPASAMPELLERLVRQRLIGTSHAGHNTLDTQHHASGT